MLKRQKLKSTEIYPLSKTILEFTLSMETLYYIELRLITHTYKRRH